MFRTGGTPVPRASVETEQLHSIKNRGPRWERISAGLRVVGVFWKREAPAAEPLGSRQGLGVFS
jgi:hypothetical protein